MKAGQISDSGSVLYKKKIGVVIFTTFCPNLLRRENLRLRFSQLVLTVVTRVRKIWNGRTNDFSGSYT